MKKKKKKRIRGGIQSHKEKQLRLKANDEQTTYLLKRFRRNGLVFSK